MTKDKAKLIIKESEGPKENYVSLAQQGANLMDSDVAFKTFYPNSLSLIFINNKST